MTQTNDYVVGQTDRRPWGEWAVIDLGAGFCVKRITVAPGGILSLQRHQHRTEEWVMVAGTGVVTLDGRDFELSAGDRVRIECGAIHRIRNAASDHAVFIEVQMGEILSEADIERIEDSYGRS